MLYWFGIKPKLSFVDKPNGLGVFYIAVEMTEISAPGFSISKPKAQQAGPGTSLSANYH